MDINADIKNVLCFPSLRNNGLKILLFNTIQKKLAFYDIYVCRILV